MKFTSSLIDGLTPTGDNLETGGGENMDTR